MKSKQRPDEFTPVYRQYREEIYKYCYLKLSPDAEAAEDCMQNAFIALFEKLKQGVEVQYPRAFLYKAANNYVLKEYRRHEKQKSNIIPLDELEGRACDNQYKIDDDIDYEALNKRLMSILTDEEQELFRLKYIEDLKISQIKDVLNISEQAAAKRIQRMRAKIINSVDTG